MNSHEPVVVYVYMFVGLFVRFVCIRDVSSLMEDVKSILEELEQEQQMSVINIELVDNELARVFSNSKKAGVRVLFILFLFYINSGC